MARLVAANKDVLDRYGFVSDIAGLECGLADRNIENDVTAVDIACGASLRACDVDDDVRSNQGFPGLEVRDFSGYLSGLGHERGRNK